MIKNKEIRGKGGKTKEEGTNTDYLGLLVIRKKVVETSSRNDDRPTIISQIM